MEEIFTIPNILLYVLIINVIGFCAMWIDKRKAQHGSWRIQEKTLFTITLLGGGIGTILGMYAFRHKTQKLRFTLGFPVILISEIVLIIYFLIEMYL